MDYLTIGSVPAGEDCAQVGTWDYATESRRELRAFINQLRRQFGTEPDGARLRIKSNPHDFGTYHEVICEYDDSNPVATAYAYKCEAETPEAWDADARKELDLPDA